MCQLSIVSNTADLDSRHYPNFVFNQSGKILFKSYKLVYLLYKQRRLDLDMCMPSFFDVSINLSIRQWIVRACSCSKCRQTPVCEVVQAVTS